MAALYRLRWDQGVTLSSVLSTAISSSDASIWAYIGMIYIGLVGLLFDYWVFKYGMSILKCLVRSYVWSGEDADTHVELQDAERGHANPEGYCDWVVLVRNVVDTKVVKHIVRYKRPNQIHYKQEGT